MMRLIEFKLVFAGILLTTSAVTAKSPEGALKDLRSKYKSLTSLQAEFTETFQWAMTGERVDRQGSILVTADNRFRIDTAELIIVCDGENVYRHNRVRGQMIIEPIAGSDQRMLPTRILLDFGDEFDAIELAEMPVEGKPGFRLDLRAKKPDESLLTQASIWATREEMTVKRLKFTDLSGNATEYHFHHIIFNQPPPRSAFILEQPKDIELFDLRK